MTRNVKMVWRTTPDKKELVSLEGKAIKVHLYEASPSDLDQLSDAIEEVLDRVEPDLQPADALSPVL